LGHHVCGLRIGHFQLLAKRAVGSEGIVGDQDPFSEGPHLPDGVRIQAALNRSFCIDPTTVFKVRAGIAFFDGNTPDRSLTAYVKFFPVIGKMLLKFRF